MKWWGPAVGAFSPARVAAPGSFIKFYKNGQDMGAVEESIFFDNLYCCTPPNLHSHLQFCHTTHLPLAHMYPTVSIFGGASVTANFGATPFQFPPPVVEDVAGCNWVAVESRAREAPPWLEYLQRFKAEEARRPLL